MGGARARGGGVCKKKAKEGENLGRPKCVP